MAYGAAKLLFCCLSIKSLPQSPSTRGESWAPSSPKPSRTRSFHRPFPLRHAAFQRVGGVGQDVAVQGPRDPQEAEGLLATLFGHQAHGAARLQDAAVWGTLGHKEATDEQTQVRVAGQVLQGLKSKGPVSCSCLLLSLGIQPNIACSDWQLPTDLDRDGPFPSLVF